MEVRCTFRSHQIGCVRRVVTRPLLLKLADRKGHHIFYFDFGSLIVLIVLLLRHALFRLERASIAHLQSLHRDRNSTIFAQLFIIHLVPTVCLIMQLMALLVFAKLFSRELKVSRRGRLKPIPCLTSLARSGRSCGNSIIFEGNLGRFFPRSATTTHFIS